MADTIFAEKQNIIAAMEEGFKRNMNPLFAVKLTSGWSPLQIQK
jgi:hypothetical protein